MICEQCGKKYDWLIDRRSYYDPRHECRVSETNRQNVEKCRMLLDQKEVVAGFLELREPRRKADDCKSKGGR